MKPVITVHCSCVHTVLHLVRGHDGGDGGGGGGVSNLGRVLQRKIHVLVM